MGIGKNADTTVSLIRALLSVVLLLVLIGTLSVLAYTNLKQYQLNSSYGETLMHSPCSRPGDNSVPPGYGPPLPPGMEGGLGGPGAGGPGA